MWFSISNDLKLDAQRDLKDVGCHISVIDGCQVACLGVGMSCTTVLCVDVCESAFVDAMRSGRKVCRIVLVQCY